MVTWFSMKEKLIIKARLTYIKTLDNGVKLDLCCYHFLKDLGQVGCKNSPLSKWGMAETVRESLIWTQNRSLHFCLPLSWRTRFTVWESVGNKDSRALRCRIFAGNSL